MIFVGGRARDVGVAAAVLVVLGACSDAPLGERDDLAEAMADRAGATELAALETIAAQRDEVSSADVHDELGAILAEPEPPDGVADVRVSDRWQSRVSERVVQVVRPMALLPEEGEPFCVVVGLGSDGTAAGARADGDVDEACGDAVIPRQAESREEGNPLDVWPQTDKVL